MPIGMDELERRLKRIEDLRQQLEARVSKSLDELDEIEDTINEVRTRQVERMKEDPRVDDAIIEQVQGDTE